MLNASNSIIPNLYTYCDNDPVNMVDYSGSIAASVMTLAAVIAPLIQQYGPQIIDFLTKSIIIFGVAYAVGESSYSIYDTVISRPRDVELPKVKSIEITSPTSLALTKADEKVRIKVNNPMHTYYEAYRYSGLVCVGKGITQAASIDRLRLGKNVFTMFMHNAYKVCAMAGNAVPMLHMVKTKKANYYNHFHINKHINSAHCWFLI